MTFTDDLTLVLDMLILLSATVFYTGFFVWYHSRRNDAARAATHLREGAFVLTILGGLIGIIALWGEFNWPLPGAYNLYFFDPLLMLALLAVTFGIAVILRLPTHFAGALGLVIGCGVMYYGVRADYYLALTQDPTETLLLYLGFGAVAILAYPVTLYVDWFVQGRQNPSLSPIASALTPTSPRMWTILLGAFMIMVALAGFAAAAYGLSAAWSHLESPP